jgi:hypothetical protein
MDEIRELIASDSYAMTFQSLGQYRTALLRAIAEIQAGEEIAYTITEAGRKALEGKK